MEQTAVKLQSILDIGLKYAPTILMALVTLILGLWLVNLLTKMINKAMERSKIDLSLRTFLKSFISILLKVLLLVSIAGMLGIETSSFIAILGAAGLAVGLALQGSLANLAGGVLILLFKPFRVGDFIEAQGFSGSVKEIQVFSTILATPDNKTIVIPNGNLSNNSIINYSREARRRIDFKFGIGYGDDIQKAKGIIQGLIDQEERILKDPVPFIGLVELGDSSVNFAVRVWCNTPEYWDIFFKMQEDVKLAFDKNGVSIPYPQQDVHLYKHD